MNNPAAVFFLMLSAILGGLIGALIMWIRDRLALRGAIRVASQQALAQSRSTLKGQIAEQMAPMLAGFPYQPADARFLGDPIDYVVFDGYSNCNDAGEGEPLELGILEIKH